MKRKRPRRLPSKNHMHFFAANMRWVVKYVFSYGDLKDIIEELVINDNHTKILSTVRQMVIY